MASVKNILTDWTGDRGERHDLYTQIPGLPLRWLNEGQLRFADRSGILRGLWSPTLLADGIATLPDDWLREVHNRVRWESDKVLVKGDFHTLRVGTHLGTDFYAIWDGKFYVFGAAAGSPTIPYVRKPAVITAGQISFGDLELPTEFHHDVITFLDANFFRRNGDVQSYHSLIKEFDNRALNAGIRFGTRNDAPPMMQGGML